MFDVRRAFTVSDESSAIAKDIQYYPATFRPDPAQGVKTIAHRGVSDKFPENTLAAFERAVEMQADYIELDVQMSKDDELIVMHDETIDRTTNGTGKLLDLEWGELQQLDAGSWFDPIFTNERIPTLSQVLDQFADRIGLLIELKNPMLYQGIEKELAEILKKKGRDKPDYKPPLIVHSFDAVSMHIFHQFSPLVPVGILIDSRQRITPGMLSRFAGYASYVNPHKSLIGRQQVRRIHRFNMGVIAWTAEQRNDIPHLLRAGVDGIMTNDPDYVIGNQDQVMF